LSVLPDAGFGWLQDLLVAFNSGDIARFDALFAAHAPGSEVLAANTQFLKQKIRILALMELVFSRRSDNRNLTFVEVSQACQVPVDQVELVVMKALSLELVKGTIDQVDQIVRIKWVQPRVLHLNQIAQLRDRLEDWVDNVHKTAIFVEESAPDVFSQQVVA
jgi:26S proteasome regulatory subunit N9